MKSFKSNLSGSMESFLKLKVALGFSRKSYEYQLHNIDDYMAEIYPEKTILDEESVKGWSCPRVNESQNCLRARLFVITTHFSQLKIGIGFVSRKVA